MICAARALRMFAAAVVVAGGLIVASCGGGSVATTPLSTATSAPATQSIPGTGSLNVASSSTQVASVGFTGAPAGISLTATSSTTGPGVAPAISSFLRTTESISGAVPFFYVTFSVSANISSQYITSESVTLTSSDPTTASYGAAFDDITTSPGTELGTAGPGTIANGVVTIANPVSATAPTLQAGHTYLIQFFYVPAGTVQPSPSPSPSASASPGFFTGGSANTGAASNCGTTACAALSVPAPPFSTTVTFGAASAPVEMFVTLGSGLQTPSPGTYTSFTGTGTVEEYLQISASVNVTVAQTPSIMVTGLTGVSGCRFYIFTNNNIWAEVSPATTGSTTVTNGSVTLPMAPGVGGNGQPNGQPVNIGTTPAYGAVACS
jgi:hypothetical protein